MPELPEVETVRLTITPLVINRRINGVHAPFPGVVHGLSPAAFAEAVVGQTLVRSWRRGKFLGFTTDQGAAVLFHLRMTGRLLVCKPEMPIDAHTRLYLSLQDDAQELELRFIDMRKFGRVYYLPNGNMNDLPTLARMGPEPLDPSFTPERLGNALLGSKAPIKAALLDQNRLAGLGNIYADEALYRAGIHPQRPAGSLDDVELTKLHEAIQYVLRQGIVYGGTTIRSYVNGRGQTGQFQGLLRAYGRAGEPCDRCGAPMTTERVGGRSSCFCVHCQK